MTEPLSFVASVFAVASLAEQVFTRGYLYLKAVKNCPDEVRSLMAETNVLCGILGRLNVLLGGNSMKSGAPVKLEDNTGQDSKDNDETDDEHNHASDEDEMISTSENGTSETPF